MDLISALESLVDELKSGLGQASLLDELEKLRVDFLGRKGRLAAMMASLPKLAPEDRPKAGQEPPATILPTNRHSLLSIPAGTAYASPGRRRIRTCV